MNLTKENLAKYGAILGLIAFPLFIIWWVFAGITNNSGFAHVIYLTAEISSIVLWVTTVVVGILVIVEALKETATTKPEWWILFLLGGIFLIIFPLVGGILLLIVWISHFGGSFSKKSK